jgi:hypothetical protein
MSTSLESELKCFRESEIDEFCSQEITLWLRVTRLVVLIITGRHLRCRITIPMLWRWHKVVSRSVV